MANIRTPSPSVSSGGLEEILDLVQALRNSYGEEVVRRVASVIDRGEGPEVLRARITRELEGAAADHAERLLDQWSTKIDSADSWVVTMGSALSNWVVVVVDPLCPRLPEAADAFPDGASLQPRDVVSALLRDIAPATARSLGTPPTPGMQAVVAFTFGRVLACERDMPTQGDA